MQLSLALDQTQSQTSLGPVPARFGLASVVAVQARCVLTKPAGRLEGFDYSLNPYSGCAFGCSYCYAAFFVLDEKRENWGNWVEAKVNAVALLRKANLRGAKLIMSSVTDPYQPLERRLGLTRAILEELVRQQPDFVVQTRGPLVTRDINLLRQFERVQVNMTVTTDDDRIRRLFEPCCASIERRLNAITEVAKAGIPARVVLGPLLPVTDPAAFARRLAATGCDIAFSKYFHVGPVRDFASNTRPQALALAKRLRWTEARFTETLQTLRGELHQLGVRC